jgi:hypothetical protein
MATRSYARQLDVAINPVQLAQGIDAALSRMGTVCRLNSLTIDVTHPDLVAGDDATITAVIVAYVYDPGFGLGPEAITLLNIIATLRQWALDATSEVAAWDAQTQAQKNVALKVVVTRLGVLCDRLADVLTVTGKGS